MNKQLLLKVVEEVIDRGGSLSIHLNQYNTAMEWPWEKTTEVEALTLAEQFQEAIEIDQMSRTDNDSVQGVSGFTVRNDQFSGFFSFHNNLIEDVDLSGSEEPLPFADLKEIMKEDMRSEEYVSSFDLKKGEYL